MATRYLIVGCSVGAIGAVEAIREVDQQGEIVMISREPHPAYSRPMISDYLAGKADLQRMLYRPTRFYEDQRVTLLLGRGVGALDVVQRTVELDDGSRLGWDRLLLATGASPSWPPIASSDKRGVYCFTTLGEAQAIAKAVDAGAQSATVVGGGLIGVSVAEALVKRGLRVALVELRERILSLSLDVHSSEMVAEAMRHAGVQIVTGHSVAAITGKLGAPDVVGGVVLDDGRHLPSDLVILAIGVRPRVELARAAGLEVGQGIIVNRRMATSAADVYACGDAAEAPTTNGSRRVMPLWPLAYMGGRAAGHNMAGKQSDYQGSLNLSTLKYFGVRLVAAGSVDAEDDGQGETLTSEGRGVYRKVVIRGNRVAGMLFIGDIERSGLVFGLMRHGVDVSAFQDRLVEDDFDLSALPADLRRQMLTMQA